ncbi:glycosyltransferase family 4 protein [Gottschalkiaceae bacterium SANA]|nr:glycosyltransferase family 4 protein [Gottschalkiaceae bacterium SANA]
MERQTIVFIRSGTIENDSRLQKEVGVALKAGYTCVVLGWDRNRLYEETCSFKTPYGRAKVRYFSLRAHYGSGLANAGRIIHFNRWIYKQLRAMEKDLTIIHACDLDTALPTKWIAKKYKKRLIYDIYDYYVSSHTIPTKWGKALVAAIENSVINAADCSLICTEQRRDQISKAKPKRLEVIYNSPDLSILDQQRVSGRRKERLKIVYVGILQGDRLLLEVAEVIKGRNDMELHIGGFGLYEEAFKDAGENIFYYGRMAYKQVLELEKEADILFATYNPMIENHRYSAPNKIYEAMALGKAIIVCKETIPEDLIKQIGLGIRYSGADFLEAAKQLKSADLRNELGKNGRALYEKRYSWSLMEAKLLDIYEGSISQ